MPKISVIEEADGIEKYLKKRQLLKQYLKAKNNILAGRLQQAAFRKRNPKSSNCYYFRINDQFRAIGYFEGEILVITAIDNHQ